jgi:hypothetical protein
MQDWSEVFVPLGVMTSFVVVIALALYAQYRNKRLIIEVLRITVERNETVDPKLVEAIARSTRTPGMDLRRGLILIAIAAATIVFGYGFGVLTRAALGIATMGLAAFPGFVGLTYLVFHFLERRTS